MTKNSRLDEFLSSIFKDHVDSKNTEVLPKKKDAEKNFDKLIEMINEEDSNVASLNSLQKPELSDLINNVREEYRDLFDRYDRLTEKLKENIRQQDSTDSFNFSFVSESSDSEELFGKENSEDYISSKDYRDLQEQLQGANEEVQTLEDELQSMKENMKVLKEENRALQEQLLDANKKINELENAKILQFESLNVDLEEVKAKTRTLEDSLQSMIGSVKSLQEENRDLKQTSVEEEEKLKQTIENIREQNEALVLDNKEIANKLHEEAKFTEELKIELQQMKDKLTDLESENTSLKQECNDKAQELVNLNQQLNSIIKEHEALKFQYSELMIKSQEVERSLTEARDQAILGQKAGAKVFTTRINQLISENENLKGDIDNLEQKLADEAKRFSMELDEAKNKHSLAYEELNMELENTKKEAWEMKHNLEAAKEENKSCQVQIEKVGLEWEATNCQLAEIKNNLEAEFEKVKKLTSENSRLSSELESKGMEQMELLNELKRVKEEKSSFEEHKHKLQEAMENSCAEIQKLTNDIEQLNIKVNQLEGTVETQKNNVKNKYIDDKKTELEKELDAEKLRVSALEAKLEAEQNEAAARIQNMIADRDDTLYKLQSMHQRESELQDQMKVIAVICLQNQTMMEEWGSKILSRISNNGSMLESLRSQCQQLLEECKHLKGVIQKHSKKLEISESVKEEQSKEIKRLADSSVELLQKLKLTEAEKADISRDFSKLQSHNNALEVVHRLASQCLHVTQAENKEMEEKLRDKGKELLSLSGQFALLQNEQRSVEATLSSGVSKFCAELGNMEVLFAKNQKNIERRLSMCVKELENLKTNVDKQLREKLMMVDQLPELRPKLMAYHDALTIQLVEKKKEVEKLQGSMVESNKRLALMEKALKEMQEEKREAIRQLCLLIEFHREDAEYYRGLHRSKPLQQKGH